MSEQRSFIYHFAEAIERYRAERCIDTSQGTPARQSGRLRHVLHWFLPNGGTILLIVVLILTQRVWAKPLLAPAAAPGPSATTVNYQGRLANSGGSPLSGTYGMSFSLWDAASGGTLKWGPENHAAVPVSEGLFSVGLGSQTSGGIPTNVWDGDRYLQITVGGETLSPRELIRSVPIAGMALTVPDSSIKVEHLGPTATGKWTMFNDAQYVVLRASGGSFDWQIADISEKVPASAKIAYVVLYHNETKGRGWCTIRPHGSTGGAGPIVSYTPLADFYSSSTGMVTLNDSKFEYKCGLQSGATMVEMGIQLWGYYEPGH